MQRTPMRTPDHPGPARRPGAGARRGTRPAFRGRDVRLAATDCTFSSPSPWNVRRKHRGTRHARTQSPALHVSQQLCCPTRRPTDDATRLPSRYALTQSPALTLSNSLSQQLCCPTRRPTDDATRLPLKLQARASWQGTHNLRLSSEVFAAFS